ncbi:hypothetical protein SBA_ch1_20100 [Sphingomonas bisphenolicum]|uniref:Uncharacterized protein n=1 Tax=Sphingomonas bisphenolicum TaxID=296544 RepID=A0ABN5WDA3_9SPHN|nr:hypothetical protein SBA_ch1_20100 [Sphingomonas bisphenolicum]
MIIPHPQRFPLFFSPIMPLIDAGDPGSGTPDMIKYGLGNFEADTQPLKAGGQGSSEIMKAPRGQGIAAIDTNQFIELLLLFCVRSEACATRCRENPPLSGPPLASRDAIKFCHCQIVERDAGGLTIFRAVARQRQFPLILVKFVPMKPCNFLSPLPGGN